ncbi:MAG TPA: hypothetical protein VN904_03630 [Chthoniobacterales bacterium]|nr:hypothetical protein [Chthoniobacterales bacterium]
MDIATLANIINAFALTAGVIFAAAQIQYYRQRRRRDAMLELVRSFQSPAFTAALRRVLSLPDGADAKKIREVLGPDGEDAVYLVSLTWESLGILLFRREVTMELVDDFFSGPILISWQKLKVYAEEWRRELKRDTGSEWFHWLAERDDGARETFAARAGLHRASRLALDIQSRVAGVAQFLIYNPRGRRERVRLGLRKIDNVGDLYAARLSKNRK